VRRRLAPEWLGRKGYAPVHALMEQRLADRQAGKVGDSVLFVEHEPVVTLGRGASAENVLLPREALVARGVELVATGRGGDVTLHAPGQLVCYPIVDLSPDRRDVRRYVADLRETMRRLAADFGVAGGPVEELIGLWVDAERPSVWEGAERAGTLAKLGAIGVRISRWVTMHGFAFNLTTDLALYDLIVPCGISSHGVTSIQALTGRSVAVQEAAPRAFELLCEVLDAEGTSFTAS
jgi:lipoyl(octanoyl) transferase